MNNSKKSEVITFRTDTETKEMLNILAKDNRWSTSQVVETLVHNFMENPYPSKITIKTEELKRIYDEIIADKAPVTELTIMQITDMEDEPEEETYWGILASGLECGGLGAIDGYEPIRALTKEEIANS